MLTSGATVNSVSLTGDQNIDGLLGLTAWGGGTITFSFPSSYTAYNASNGYGSGIEATLANSSNYHSVEGEPAGNLAQLILDANRGNAWDDALTVEGFTGLTINKTTANPDANIRIGYSDYARDYTIAASGDPNSSGNPAFAWLPESGWSKSGDVWIDTESSGGTMGRGQKGAALVMHEIGHALGLKHAHTGEGTSNSVVMDAAHDSVEYSVMTYHSWVGDGDTGGYEVDDGSMPQTFMMYDIAALQHMYGADYGSNNGSNTYSWNPNNGNTYIDGEVLVGNGKYNYDVVFMTLWDGGGANDLFDLTNYVTNLEIDLRPGASSDFGVTDQRANLGWGGGQYHYASGNVYNALLHDGDTRSLIENVQGGSGNDSIKGNQTDNILRGNDGNDKLWGFEGYNVLRGGNGADRISGGSASTNTLDWNEMYGNAGADRFVFTGDVIAKIMLDEVIDFEDGVDKLEFQGSDGITWAMVRDAAKGDGHGGTDIVFSAQSSDGHWTYINVHLMDFNKNNFNSADVVIA